MHETVSFGRILGIRVGANWSVLIIATLLAFGLAVGALPEAAPDYQAGVYWVAAVLAALVFFASLLAHELAHALVARRAGMPVEGITLWALGGVSKLGDDAPDAGTEFRVAIVGPATSLLLAVTFFVLNVAVAALGVPDVVVATLGWLAAINLLLGLFNLAPAFPLDGGRVLRAILWGMSDDRVQATRTAVAIGRGFGYLLTGAGFLLALSGFLINGLWFVLLGWFVLNIAQAELSRVEQRDLLAGLRVSDIMTADPVCAPADITVADFLERYVMTKRHSSYPLVDLDHRLVGFLTLEAVRRVPPAERATTLTGAAAVPGPEVPVASPDDLLTEVLARLGTSPVGRIVVSRDSRVIGLVSGTDVASCIERRALTAATPPRRRTGDAGGEPDYGRRPPAGEDPWRQR
jgi:Zn-dependent protease/CBS domain-containing protein